MDLRRVRRWEWLTGAAGVVLLVSLFLDWYDSASGWEAFSVIDVILAIAALGAMALPAVAAAQRTAAVPQATTALLMPFALAAVIVAVVRLVNPPGSGAEREIGVWLGTLAAFAVFFLNARSMGDPRTPHAMRSRLDVDTIPAPTADGERRDLAT